MAMAREIEGVFISQEVGGPSTSQFKRPQEIASVGGDANLILGQVVGGPSLPSCPSKPARQDVLQGNEFHQQNHEFVSRGLLRDSRFYINIPKAPLCMPYSETDSEEQRRSLAEPILENVRRPGEVLTPQEIDWGMAVCQTQNPEMGGLQSIDCYLNSRILNQIHVPVGEFVQIVPILSNPKCRWQHAISCSNVFSPSADSVNIYDCEYDRNLYGFDMKLLISRLFRPNSNRIKVIFSNVQRQSVGSNLCCLFAMWHSLALCKHIEPERLKFDEATIRDDSAALMEAHMHGKQDVVHPFHVSENLPNPLDTMVIDLCPICKLACETSPCFKCQKRCHNECYELHTLTKSQKYLCCKLCGV